MFDKSLKYKEMDAAVRSQSLYWKGESNYRLGNSEAARNDWEMFRQMPGAPSLPEYDLIDYNLGYVYFNDGDYAQALPFFLSFNEQGQPGDTLRYSCRCTQPHWRLFLHKSRLCQRHYIL